MLAPIVETNYGKIEGFESDGAEVFLAIPYAKPPTGDLRFERPEAPEPFEDIYQATQYRNDCSPHYRLVSQFSVYSGEDCLTLNVIKPKTVTEKLPVLLWIHGGGYSIGSASQHGYKYFAERYASENVIVVTIQYRLGFLGFFANDQVSNLGLFDQVAALEYVHENIEHFGGDPERITLWGYSAGGASVSQLTISPYSQDLYQNAIIMSASSFAGWATGSTVREHSEILMRDAGCDSIECLKKKDLHDLYDAQEKSGFNTGTIDILKWAPIIDGDFFPAHPSELLESAPVKPTLLGRVLSDFGLTAHDIKNFNEQFVIDTIKNKFLYNNRFGKYEKYVLDTLIEYYLHRDRPEHPEVSFFLDRYSEIVSDVTFNVPEIREIQKRAENNDQVYAYLFNHCNDVLWKDHIPKETRGSLHVNEYHYLFNMPILGQIDFSKDPEKKIRNDFIDLVINFAKTGKAEVNGVQWNPVTAHESISYLNIGTEGNTIKSGLFEEATYLWNDLAHQTEFDAVDPTLSKSSQHQPRNEL
ncbi:unnamed protein product [Caenorhabditis angaria]|uniref:Carboxylic ester hydrolase n=1 Tax=Caenorhabditis angaria TaxID=860376 RepID=A0A9P1J089_9PELO|nr:unnamed protein product [Caenorhabditis angaria]